MNDDKLIEAIKSYRVLKINGLEYVMSRAMFGETTDTQFVAVAHYHITARPLYCKIDSCLEFETIQCETEEQSSEYLCRAIDDFLQIAGGSHASF